MKCIYCNFKKTDILNSRATNNKTSVWRRRACLNKNCGKIFTTKETTLSDNLFVIKRNKSRQRFLYEKLFVSIFTSLQIGKYNDNGDLAKLTKKISEKIIQEICNLGNKNIETREITKIVYGHLKKINISSSYKYRNYSPFRIEILKKEL